LKLWRMKGLLVVIVALLGFLTFAQGQCPMNAGNPAGPDSTLSFCTQYRSNTCCPNVTESELKNNTETKVPPLFGRTECFQNIRGLLCSWLCSPNQRNIIKVDPGFIPNVTVYVSQAWADQFFASCKGVCLPFGGGVPVEQQYANSGAFVAQFSSANDATYVPDLTHPNLVFILGSSPTGQSVNITEVPLQQDPAQGCGVAKETSSASRLFLSVHALLLLIILMFSC